MRKQAGKKEQESKRAKVGVREKKSERVKEKKKNRIKEKEKEKKEKNMGCSVICYFLTHSDKLNIF